jgi:transcriptional repressor NrdR
MKCPYCGEIDNKVIDSRLSKDASVIRRRRECIVCSRRFTTYEHIEEIPIMIVKKDGRREVFNREKVRSGLKKACQKRNISINVIEEFIDDLERDLRETGEKEIPQCFMNSMMWPMYVLPRFTGNLRMSTTLYPSSKPCSVNRSDF